MADLSDVASALAQLAQAAVYPNGLNASSIAGTSIIIYPGWPDSETLQRDLAADQPKIHVSVWPRPGEQITSTVMGDGDWQEGAIQNGRGMASLELRRVARQFQITVWAPTPQLRDKVGAAIDALFAGKVRVNLADGSKATLAYLSQAQNDEQQKEMIYRRDLIYVADFPTVSAVTATAIITVQTVLETDMPMPAGLVALGSEITVTTPREAGS